MTRQESNQSKYKRASRVIIPSRQEMMNQSIVALSFKNKTIYTPYVSPRSQISYIDTNKGNINGQCSVYNILSIKNITSDSKKQKDNSDLQVKTPIP